LTVEGRYALCALVHRQGNYDRIAAIILPNLTKRNIAAIVGRLSPLRTAVARDRNLSSESGIPHPLGKKTAFGSHNAYIHPSHSHFDTGPLNEQNERGAPGIGSAHIGCVRRALNLSRDVSVDPLILRSPSDAKRCRRITSIHATYRSFQIGVWQSLKRSGVHPALTRPLSQRA
jgi:hypothetical protein